MVATPSGDPLADGRGAGRRRIYDRIAPCYDLVDLPFEYTRYRKLRPLLFDGLRGRILDAGVGTGRNIPFYPPGADVIGIDVSPAMLRRAERRRGRSNATVQLRQMDVTNLDFPDATFNAVVATFLFCTLPDELHAPALCELSRVLKPGGRLRLLDYRRPRNKLRRFIARLWEPWAKWAFGASFDRHPERYLAQAGLEMTSGRFVAGDLIMLVEARHEFGSKSLGSTAIPERLPDPAALRAGDRSSKMTGQEKSPPRLAFCLLLLRLGVAVVMLFWTADKFVNPHHAGGVFSRFYGLEGLSSGAFLVIGGVEALVVVAFTIGLLRTFSYGAVLLLHTASTLSSWRQYTEPFDNLLFLAAWPMLAACITLFLLRRNDEFTVDRAFGIGTAKNQSGAQDRGSKPRDCTEP